MIIWIALAPTCLNGLSTSIQAVSSEDNFTLMQSVKRGITQAMKSVHTHPLLFMSSEDVRDNCDGGEQTFHRPQTHFFFLHSTLKSLALFMECNFIVKEEAVIFKLTKSSLSF